jgi:hypothetical protein
VVQTADMSVEVYIRRILGEQSSVDACARLVDAECRCSPSKRLDNDLKSSSPDQRHMTDTVQSLQGSFAPLNNGEWEF